MVHMPQADDPNIIQVCRKNNKALRENKYFCTFDEDYYNEEQQQDVTAAITAVVESRHREFEWMGKVVNQSKNVINQLSELIQRTDKLIDIADSKDNVCIVATEIQEQLQRELKTLEENNEVLSDSRRVMERENIRVPVVGVINSGKSTFLRSALGSENKQITDNLFPTAGVQKSCTGTCTVLVYDNKTDKLTVKVWFKNKKEFIESCKKATDNLIKELKDTYLLNLKSYPMLQDLKENLEKSKIEDIITVLSNYGKTREFISICRLNWVDKTEIINSFCSMIHFVKNETFMETARDQGNFNSLIDIKKLKQSWVEGTNSPQIIPDNNYYKDIKQYVCKFDPENPQIRFSTYFGIQKIEIRGQLCPKIAGLELVDSIGGNDKAISNDALIQDLTENSDAVILLERPQSQQKEGWSIKKYIDTIKNQIYAPGVYLVYNCDQTNNITDPSYVRIALDEAKLNDYDENCKQLYITDLNISNEVQSRMLVGMLINLADNIKEVHEKCLNQAYTARDNINRSIDIVKKLTNDLLQKCNVEDDNVARQQHVDQVIKNIRDEIKNLFNETRSESDSPLRNQAIEITENLIKNLQGNLLDNPYEYLRVNASDMMYNRYTEFLCLYSQMLESIRKQFYIMRNTIDCYVEKKRKDILNIFWEQGRFKNIVKVQSLNELEISEWLKEHHKPLSDILEDSIKENLGVDANELIQNSIDKQIQQFCPKHLTVEELFGSEISELKEDMNMNELNQAMKKQLLSLAEELQSSLMNSIKPDNMNRFYQKMPYQQANEMNQWATLMRNNAPQESLRQLDVNLSDINKLDVNPFDLDSQLRVNKICGVLKKLSDQICGGGFAYGKTSMYELLYELYFKYYDNILTKEEVNNRYLLSKAYKNLIEQAEKVSKTCNC